MSTVYQSSGTVRDNNLLSFTVPDDVDPFACLTHSIYISGQLTLIRTPAGTCGDWLCIDDIWHRRLDARAFVWLRDAVKSAIRSGKLSEAFTDALTTLDWIRDIGIRNGVFTAREVADHVHPPTWFEFNSDLPYWANEW